MRDFDDAQACDTERYGALFRHLLDARHLRRAVAVRGAVRLARPRRRRRSTGRSRPLATSSTADLWDAIADEAARREPALGRGAAPAPSARARAGLLAARASARYALGLETIYEGYLLHYGRPRLFAPRTRDTALLLGDYLYAHGLVRIADARRRRRGRRPRRADLALRAAPRRGRATATARPGRRRPRCSAAGSLRASAASRRRSPLGARASGRRRRARARLALHAAAWVRLAPMLALLADAAKEGRDIITGMLIVGLIFLGVIGARHALAEAAQEALASALPDRAARAVDRTGPVPGSRRGHRRAEVRPSSPGRGRSFRLRALGPDSYTSARPRGRGFRQAVCDPPVDVHRSRGAGDAVLRLVRPRG